MKNDFISKNNILLILIFVSFIVSLSLFIVLDFSNIKADTENSEIYHSNENNHLDKAFFKTYVFSPFNPQNPIEESHRYDLNLKNQFLIKEEIIQKLNPVSFYSLLNEEKKEIFNEIESLLSKNIITKEDIFNAILPSYQIILSILYTDTFAISIISNSYDENNSSVFYRNFLYLRKIYLPLRNVVFELFNFYFKEFQEPNFNYKKTSMIMKKSDYLIPRTKELKYNHRNAIDIFFKKVSKYGNNEIGPAILSFTSGIVVASENDWEGSTTLSSYKSGGISPKSGNGVIIYDPVNQRFILYFHLFKTSVEKGQIIKAGQLIGFGGNTGINARKKGHGKHLHLEIFDIAKDRFLTCYELKDLLFK